MNSDSRLDNSTLSPIPHQESRRDLSSQRKWWRADLAIPLELARLDPSVFYMEGQEQWSLLYTWMVKTRSIFFITWVIKDRFLHSIWIVKHRALHAVWIAKGSSLLLFHMQFEDSIYLYSKWIVKTRRLYHISVVETGSLYFYRSNLIDVSTPLMCN